MKSFTLIRSIRTRVRLVQTRFFQPDFVPADPKSKPKKYKLPATSYDPYGPRPPPCEKIIQLAEKIAALPPEECMQIGPTLRERLSHPKMQSISVQGATGAKIQEKVEKTAFDTAKDLVEKVPVLIK